MGGVNKNGPPKLMYLYAWTSACGIAWEGLGAVALVGGSILLGMGFAV